MPDSNPMIAIITEYGSFSAAQVRGFGKVTRAASEEQLPALLATERADVLIALYSKGHEAVADIAVQATKRSGTAVLLLFDAGAPMTVLKKCAEAGVMVAHISQIELMVPAVKALRTRLKAFETQTDSLQQKLDDVKLINRAKLLLMSRLGMTEAEAHRYIEKTAMDHSQKRSTVASDIIRVYEE